MKIRHDPAEAPPAEGRYSHGVEIATPGRMLFISSQAPMDSEGNVPDAFEEQCLRVWTNVKSVLSSAGMTTMDLVKVTTYLSSATYKGENAAIRQRVLGDAKPALTVILGQIYDGRWLLEIEAVAFRATGE